MADVYLEVNGSTWGALIRAWKGRGRRVVDSGPFSVYECTLVHTT